MLLGAWVAADTTAFLQIMVSQPLVAAWLGGLVVGEPLLGLSVGIALQAVWGGSFGLGAAGFPFAGPASVAAGGLAGWSARGAPVTSWGVLRVPDAASLALALAVGFATAEAGRAAILFLRRHRTHLVRRALDGAARGDPRAVVAANLTGIAEDAGVGLALTSLALAGGLGLRPLVVGAVPASGLWVLLPVLGAGLGRGVSAQARPRIGFTWLVALVLVVLVLRGIGGGR